MTMNDLLSTSHDHTLDELLKILSDAHCRSILWHFQQSPEEVYTTSRLEKIITQREGTEVKQTDIQLRHSTLPRLEDAGVIEYDPRSNAVRYQGHSDLEALLDAILEWRGEQPERDDDS